DRPGRSRGRLRDVLPRRRDAPGGQQPVGRRRRRGVHRHRRPALRRGDPGGGGRPQRQGDHLHPRPRRPRAGRAGAARGHPRSHPAAPGRPAPVGADPHRRAVGRGPRGRPDHQGRRCRAQGAPHARPCPGCGVPLRPRPRLRVHRRHPLPGWSGRDGSLVQRRGPDQGLDPLEAAGAARRDRGAHRPRTGHDHRGRTRRSRL
ncbi:MAG: Putative hydrolase in cluster with formaldehyde/S-nitrosomycothiol reductase MscR, partial [uncultured Nocardioides sp.]